jgi:hypothetical protein
VCGVSYHVWDLPSVLICDDVAKDPSDCLSPLTSAKSYFSESRYSARYFPANIPWPMTGWNTTHTTGYHDKWVDDPKSFSLPAPHLFWSKSGKNPPEGGSGGSMTPTAAPTTTAASITSDRSLSSRVGPLIAQYKTNTKDGQFASFLADFERALN